VARRPDEGRQARGALEVRPGAALHQEPGHVVIAVLEREQQRGDALAIAAQVEIENKR